MGNRRRYEAEWEDYVLVIEDRSEYSQAFVYDPGGCEVLYTCQRMSLDAAKFTAVEFAATARFGPKHDLQCEIVAAMLIWEPT
jgi:hypothetical protein